jgi:hypothetical protein
MLDDVGEHFAEFLERRFLCSHMPEVYHAAHPFWAVNLGCPVCLNDLVLMVIGCARTLAQNQR